MSFSIQKQKGINLIELMIASLLSVLILFFMIKITTTTNQTASRSEGLAQAQETSRLVLGWLNTESKRAGLRSDPEGSINNALQPPLAALCTAANAAPPADTGHCTFETTNASGGDRLAIRRNFSTTSTDPKDSTDCTGVDLSANPNLVTDESILTDVYWVDFNDNINGNIDPLLEDIDFYDDTLRCVTYNENGIPVAPFQTLASGIEGMHILYAEGNLGGEGSDTYGVLTYQPADQVNMDDVISIRISILTRSFTNNSLDPGVRSYILLDSDPYTFNDRVARQILSTTVALKNINIPE